MAEKGLRPKENTSRNTHNVVTELLLEDGMCQTVLDIPCGEGAFAARCLERGLTVHAADCRDMIRTPGVAFKIADMNERLPYADAQFDAVVCIDGIEHIERPFDFIRECRRITHSGGVLVLSTPNISALRSRWRWLLTGFHNKSKIPLDEARPTPSHHINMLSFPEIRYLLHTNGYLISSVRANRIKPVSRLYAILAPLSYLSTRMEFRHEKDSRLSPQNMDILNTMFSPPVLFGETLIVKATAVGS